MSKRTVPCRVCGKEFVPCGKSSAEIGAFNYREVACSEKCGAEYLRRVLAGRSAASAETEKPFDGQVTFDELQETESVNTLSADTNVQEIVKHTEKRSVKRHMVSDDTEN